VRVRETAARVQHAARASGSGASRKETRACGSARAPAKAQRFSFPAFTSSRVPLLEEGGWRFSLLPSSPSSRRVATVLLLRPRCAMPQGGVMHVAAPRMLRSAAVRAHGVIRAAAVTRVAGVVAPPYAKACRYATARGALRACRRRYEEKACGSGAGSACACARAMPCHVARSRLPRHMHKRLCALCLRCPVAPQQRRAARSE